VGSQAFPVSAVWAVLIAVFVAYRPFEEVSRRALGDTDEAK
jgi:hypothetical protein